MYWSATPLADLTNYQPAEAAGVYVGKGKLGVAPATPAVAAAAATRAVPARAATATAACERASLVRRHDPYAWKCLDDEHVHDASFAATQLVATEDDEEAMMLQPPYSSQPMTPAPPLQHVATHTTAAATPQLSQPAHATTAVTALRALPTRQEMYHDSDDVAPPAPPGRAVCSALVQFKCHQAEYASCILLDKGQYVVVQGDRGIDIGAVIRVNTPSKRTYVEKTGVTGSVLRYATQREVDYWAADLKQAEATACAYCRAQVQRLQLDMDIVQCEYQFDKKKLTFYYEARMRVDFVQLLHDLYREFGCRIWMEKVRPRGE